MTTPRERLQGDRARGGRLPGRCILRTEDLDAARSCVSEVFLPHRVVVVDRAADLDFQLNGQRTGPVTLGYLRYGPTVRLRTAEASNYHVNTPLTGSNRSRSGRREPVLSTPLRSAVFMPGSPAEVLWGADSTQLCLMLDRPFVDGELEKLLGNPLSRPLDFAAALDLTTPAGRSWRAALGVLEREVGRGDGMLRYPLAAAHLESLVVHGLLLGHPHNYSERLRRTEATPRPRAVCRAVELIEGRPEHPWTIAELAAAASVSARTLQERFATALGVPPMTYLRDVRLDRVHGELRAADPQDVSVAAVAARWGFLHPGRFAAAYRRRFNRAPSETLRGR